MQRQGKLAFMHHDMRDMGTMAGEELQDMFWGEVERHGYWSEVMWKTHRRLGLGEI